MERGEFVAEGSTEVGPARDYFLFLDSEHLRLLLLRHLRLPEERGDTRLGRVRVTVEWLEDDEVTEEASPPSNRS